MDYNLICYDDMFCAGGQEILTLVANMEELDSDIFPSCLAVRQNLSNKGALEHLKLVRREWHSSVQQLIDVVDDLIDAHKFIEVSGECYCLQNSSLGCICLYVYVCVLCMFMHMQVCVCMYLCLSVYYTAVCMVNFLQKGMGPRCPAYKVLRFAQIT